MSFKDGKAVDEDGKEIVNISDLQSKLRRAIESNYKKIKGSNIDLTAKDTIDMLAEIESSLDSKLMKVNEIR